jgi:hypothetical protein
MFLRVVDTVVTQEIVSEDIDNEKLDRTRLSEPEQKELFDVHGEPLSGDLE